MIALACLAAVERKERLRALLPQHVRDAPAIAAADDEPKALMRAILAMQLSGEERAELVKKGHAAKGPAGHARRVTRKDSLQRS